MSDKLALIYEFNQDSPLFCRIASDHLIDGNPAEALKLLEKGLPKYPYYPSAIISYALTLAMLGKKDKAKSSLNRLAGLIYSDQTIKYYLDKIECIQPIENLENSLAQNYDRMEPRNNQPESNDHSNRCTE